MERSIVFLLFTLFAAAQAMEQVPDTGLGKPAKKDLVVVTHDQHKAPILRLPPEVLTKEIIQRSLQAGSVKERRKKIRQWALVSKQFNQYLKVAAPTKQELAWLVCDTSEKYRTDRYDEALVELKQTAINYMTPKKPQGTFSKIEYARWLSLCDAICIKDINQLFDLNTKQLSLLLRIAAGNEKCSSLIPMLLLAGADMEATLIEDYSFLGQEDVIGDHWDSYDHKNSLHLAINSGNIPALEQLLQAGADITRDSLAHTIADWQYEKFYKLLRSTTIGFSVISAAILAPHISDNIRQEMIDLLLLHGAHMRMDQCSPLDIAKCNRGWVPYAGWLYKYSQEFMNYLEQKEQEALKKEQEEKLRKKSQEKNCLIQ